MNRELEAPLQPDGNQFRLQWIHGLLIVVESARMRASSFAPRESNNTAA